MSTLNVENIKHIAADSDSLRLATDGTVTFTKNVTAVTVDSATITNLSGTNVTADSATITALSSTNVTASGDIKGSSFNGGQLGGRRNLIINGAMQVAQRGTSHTSPGYTLDRIYSDTVNGTVIQDTADVPDQFTSALKFTASSNSAYTILYQPFEASDFAVFKNKTVTVSGFVKASSDFSGQMYFHLQGGTIADTMTGGTWTTADIEYFTPTTTWQRFEATLSAPNSNGCRLVFGPALAQNSGVSWSITGLQMELGDTATPFEHRSYGEELALCQRYYRQWGGNSVNERIGVGFYYSPNNFRVCLDLNPEMRTTPSLSLSNHAHFAVEYNAGAAGNTSHGLDQASPRVAAINATTNRIASGGDAGQLMCNNTLAARLKLDAEL